MQKIKSSGYHSVIQYIQGNHFLVSVFVAKYIKSAMSFLTSGAGEKLVQGRVIGKSSQI